MIRTLLIITGASLVLCIAAISGAAAIGGNEIARNGWEWTFREGDEPHTVVFDRREEGPAVSRTLAWTGATPSRSKSRATSSMSRATPRPSSSPARGPRSSASIWSTAV